MDEMQDFVPDLPRGVGECLQTLTPLGWVTVVGGFVCLLLALVALFKNKCPAAALHVLAISLTFLFLTALNGIWQLLHAIWEVMNPTNTLQDFRGGIYLAFIPIAFGAIGSIPAVLFSLIGVVRTVTRTTHPLPPTQGGDE